MAINIAVLLIKSKIMTTSVNRPTYDMEKAIRTDINKTQSKRKHS